MSRIQAYEYVQDDRLPDGWEIAVYPSGAALICSPGTCPTELGGYAAAYVSVEAAIAATPIIGDCYEKH